MTFARAKILMNHIGWYMKKQRKTMEIHGGGVGKPRKAKENQWKSMEMVNEKIQKITQPKTLRILM